MLISPAYAQAAGAAPAGGDLFTQLMPLLLIFVVFYFLLIRPQQKKQKMHQAMLGALRRGDKIITGGGIIGTITKVKNDNELQVEIADGVKVLVARETVSTVMAKTEAADKADKSDDQSDDHKKDDDKGGKGGLKKLLGN